MPKLKLPPQGGEKWLCIFTFLFMMFSVLCTVSVIYCIVIIYIPSMKELQTNFEGPKRCTTTYVDRNITSLPGEGKCSWASCEEWCLSQGSSGCTKMYGILREVGASVTYQGCEFEAGGLVDTLCTTLDDLEAVNCKRSKYEPENPGNHELCEQYTGLFSCEKGFCKNVSQIYTCEFKNIDDDLLKDTSGGVNGFCNCNECEESNTTISGECPLQTEVCFHPDRDPLNYDEKTLELCKEPVCEQCFDICKNMRKCLNMKNRRDVVYFGVDENDYSKLTYYSCKDGQCVEIYDLKCNRTCDNKEFDFGSANVALIEAERIVMSKCSGGMFINDTKRLPEQSVINPSWNILVSSCSKVTVNREMKTIHAEDCVNGTWFENLGTVDYDTIRKKYLEYRHDSDRWIKETPSDIKSLVPWEEDIVIYNQTRIKKNQQGCVNTLSMECMRFFIRFARDGANYTARAVYDCYYNNEDPSYVILDYYPERTFYFLMFWSLVPGVIMVVSCLYMCVCSKLVFTGDDGHMRIICCGKPITGIGEVAVYTPPSKSKD